MLKKFKDKEGFIEKVGLSRSTVYFKIPLYKCLKKFPAIKNSSLSSHYFRSKSIEELFSQKKNCANGFINQYCFYFFLVLL